MLGVNKKDSYKERIPKNTLIEDSYKEKSSTPRKIGQPFTTIKSSNTLTNQGMHNLP